MGGEKLRESWYLAKCLAADNKSVSFFFSKSYNFTPCNKKFKEITAV